MPEMLTRTVVKIPRRAGHGLALAAVALVACGGTAESPPQTAIERQSAALKVGANSLLLHWAPIHYQDVNKNRWSGKGDFLTRFNYDGDWRGNNNWESMTGASADFTAAVYGKVSESRTHWFLYYGFFHPRDWDDDGQIDAGEHENDLESVTLLVRKDGSEFGILAAMETQAHTGVSWYAVAAEGITARDGVLPTETLAGESHARPRTYQQPEGHGIYGCLPGNGSKCDKTNEDGIKYVPGLVGAAPGSVKVWTPVTYAIRDMDEMWNKRLVGAGGTAEDGNPFNASEVFGSPGPMAASLRGDDGGGCGDDQWHWYGPHIRTCWGENKAAMNWSNDLLARNPSTYFNNNFTFTRFGTQPEPTYFRNDFNVNASGVACDALTKVTSGPMNVSNACSSNCADQIGQADPFCVQVAWDSICVSEVEEICWSFSVSQN